MASSGKGLPFIGKMGEFLDRVLHPTVNKTGNSKASIDVRNIGYYKSNLIPLIVESGSTDNVVKLTAHGAVAGDLFRLISTSNGIKEYDVVVDEIIDANTFKLAGFLSASLSVGDTFDLYKPTYERFTADGASLASVDSPPVKYNRKVGGITLPTEVTEDKDTPTLSRPLPVVLHGLDAASITVTSNELNISSSHTNDSVAIGNGVDKIVGVTASNELKVNDSSAGTKLDTLHTDITSTNTKLDSANTKLDTLHTDLGLVSTSANQTNGNQITQIKSGSNGNILDVITLASNPVGGDKGLVAHAIMHGKDGGSFNDVKVNSSGEVSVTMTSAPIPTGAATSAKQDTGNSSLSSIDTKLSSAATSALQTSGNTSLNNLDTNIGAKADTSATTDTGTFSLIALIKRLLERFELLKQQLPASLGIKTGAASLSVVPASDAVFVTSPKSESAGAISSNRKTLTVAGTQYRATVSGVAPTGRKKLIIKPQKDNLGSVWIGNSAVTTTTGLEFIGPDRMEFLNDNNDYYLVSDQPNTIVEILEVY